MLGYHHGIIARSEPRIISIVEKSPIRTYFDVTHAYWHGNVSMKWPMPNLWNFSKVRAVVFLLGFTLTFIIMASYILTWDKKGLLLTPSPYYLKAANVSTNDTAAAALAFSVSLKTTCLDMKQLLKEIRFKLEYPPRSVPDEKDIIGTDSHLFSAIPRHFLPGIKSPCWYEDFPIEKSRDPYSGNRYTIRSKTFKSVCDRLAYAFRRQPLRRQDGRLSRLRCLPYFYIIGQPKCGTTDLFHRLLQHPDIKFNIMKEPHWWTRKRFGYIRFKDGFQEIYSLEDYLDLFDLAAYNIQGSSAGNSPEDRRFANLITGEASASTMWDNHAWRYLHGDQEEVEPPFLAQDFLHTVQPNAKIIIMLRDPAERLYSDYLYFKTANKSTEDFHQKVLESMQVFQSCLSARSLRSCVYSTSLANSMPVRLTLGMYIVFLLDWLTVFQREQILVLRLEDYATNLQETVQKVFDFLNVGPLSEQAAATLTKGPMSNTRRAVDRSLGPMLPSTQKLLWEFHQPFNRKLASVLNNQAFLWTNTSIPTSSNRHYG
ncbi:carbohydrate sulfotransferase 15-like [Corythoichthys intestinalis]|uniref:carbohydrate sulfotransferase 15-like n=1 Tax=Corythoichthys intestinalis TaxID=161448 RepID=UPI0025A5F825|nr:carbohydrate sulfotransferase 15-like [Corythoichthys intestinalis]XP_061794413.1 carbohydrate sulfotransferase 15-like [Nerophis lumbriciformis]